MSFAISFRSELLKTRRTSPWYSALLIALFVPSVMLIDYAFQEDITDKIGKNPWAVLIDEGFILFNMILCPLYVLLTATILAQLEYRNNAWKQVLVSPQPLLNIYLSRYCVLLLFIVWVTLLHDLFLIATGTFISVVWPQYQLPEYQLDLALMMKKSIHTMVSILGISAFQFWVAVRFRSFIVPLATGFALWLLSNILTFELKVPHAELNPFTYLAHASFPKFTPMMGQIMLSSIAYCALFLTLGFINFNRNRLR